MVAITGVVTKSTKVKSICGQLKQMSGNDWWNMYVFSLWQKTVKDEDDWISGGTLFQRMDAATGNERRPTVARRYVGTCSRCDEDEHRRWRPCRSATRTIADPFTNGRTTVFSGHNPKAMWLKKLPNRQKFMGDPPPAFHIGLHNMRKHWIASSIEGSLYQTDIKFHTLTSHKVNTQISNMLTPFYFITSQKHRR